MNFGNLINNFMPTKSGLELPKSLQGFIGGLESQVDGHLDGLISNIVPSKKGRVTTGASLPVSQNRSRSNSHFGLSAMDAKKHYKNLYNLGAILECNYAVYATDIYDIQKKAGVVIPWFANSFPMSWLATEAEYSIGGSEAENFYAGSYQCNYLTQQTSDTIEITFIETKNAHIANSAKLCGDIAFPNDGSVREPKYYAFELNVMVFGVNRNLANPVLHSKYIVGVKEASMSLSSGGRSEVAKTQVTFQKLRPYDLFKSSGRW